MMYLAYYYYSHFIWNCKFRAINNKFLLTFSKGQGWNFPDSWIDFHIWISFHWSASSESLSSKDPVFWFYFLLFQHLISNILSVLVVLSTLSNTVVKGFEIHKVMNQIFLIINFQRVCATDVLTYWILGEKIFPFQNCQRDLRMWDTWREHL